MTVELSGAVFEIEGVLYAGQPSCSLRRAAGGPITEEEFDRLSLHDEATLRVIIKRHVAAVALLAGLDRPDDVRMIPASSDAIVAIGCHSKPRS